MGVEVGHGTEVIDGGDGDEDGGCAEHGQAEEEETTARAHVRGRRPGHGVSMDVGGPPRRCRSTIGGSESRGQLSDCSDVELAEEKVNAGVLVDAAEVDGDAGRAAGTEVRSREADEQQDEEDGREGRSGCWKGERGRCGSVLCRRERERVGSGRDGGQSCDLSYRRTPWPLGLLCDGVLEGLRKVLGDAAGLVLVPAVAGLLQAERERLPVPADGEVDGLELRHVVVGGGVRVGDGAGKRVDGMVVDVEALVGDDAGHVDGVVVDDVM